MENNWVDTYYKLSCNITAINRSIKRIASNSYNLDTIECTNFLLKLIEEKRRLLEEYLYYKKAYQKLDPTLKKILYFRYKKQLTVYEISKLLSLSTRTINRYIANI